MSKTSKKTVKNVKKQSIKKANEPLWINPVGGYGDILMLSGVMKLAYDKNPEQKYNLIRRTKYSQLLKGHPALGEIGFPLKDAKILNTSYWSADVYEKGEERAFQLLAKSFGLETPVEEKLYLAEIEELDPVLDKLIPWKKKNVIISPSSDSPRKMMHPIIWHNIVEYLVQQGFLVLQVGVSRDIHIKGAYSLINLTTPQQLISLIKKCTFVISSDNFIMHAAHLVDKPALVVWGPTKANVYGYKEQIHVQAPLDHCNIKSECLGPRHPQNYATMCPLGQEHCMSKIRVEDVIYQINKLL